MGEDENGNTMWEAVLWKGRLYVSVTAKQLCGGSKEAFVMLLEYAEDVLGCSHVVVCLSLISFSFSLSAESPSWSHRFCFLSLPFPSISLSAPRSRPPHSLTRSFPCSAVLGVPCKNGNSFWMPSIKFLGNPLTLL